LGESSVTYIAGTELHGVERKITYRKIAPRKPEQGTILFQILIGKHHEIPRGGMSNRFPLRHLANRIFHALLARIVDVARAKGIDKNAAQNKYERASNDKAEHHTLDVGSRIHLVVFTSI
jgi:hypothetical protein